MENSICSTNREQILCKESNPLDHEWLTTNDITLKPKLGVLRSRKEALIKPFIYSSPMDVVTGWNLVDKIVSLNHYAVSCRFLPKQTKHSIETEFRGNENLFYSIGLNRDIVIKHYKKDKAFNYKKNLSLDIAHGDTVYAHELIKFAKSLNHFPKIMSGTVCTPEGAERAYLAGCTHIRIGVGPGSACTTRLMTGCGLPNLTAVYKIYKYLSTKYDESTFTLIADGGIKHPGDAIKYLCAGADGVMLGSVLAKCYESANWKTDIDGKKYKLYRGQASLDFQQERLNIKSPRHIEGITCGKIYPEYTIKELITHYENSLRSAISYLGLSNSLQLKPENISFVKITSNGYKEGTAHGKIN